jgi:hypothetical protein
MHINITYFMKRLLFILLIAAASLSLNGQSKPKVYVDRLRSQFPENGIGRFNQVLFKKLKKIGFTDVVVDVKSIMGEVLYKSKIAPYMGEWEGHYRSEDFDMMAIFIKEGQKLGFKVHASLNIFAGGHNFFNRGVIYKSILNGSRRFTGRARLFLSAR